MKGGESQSNTTVVMLNIKCDIRATCFDNFHPTTAVTNPRLYSTVSRPTTPTATRYAHVVIRYLYLLPFPHPHLTPKYTHLRPTAPTLPFYGSIFYFLTSLVALWSEFVTTKHEAPGSIPSSTMCVFP